MLEALEVDTKKNKVKVDLGKLYDGIDIAETLSTRRASGLSASLPTLRILSGQARWSLTTARWWTQRTWTGNESNR